MTTETMLDRRLRELMAELAAPGDKSAAIDNVLSVTGALRPEPRWLVLLKERPMRTSSVLVAGSPPMRMGLIFAVIALVGRSPRPSPSVPSSCDAGAAARLWAGRQRRARLRRSGDIVTTDAAGADLTTITTGPAVDSRPVFSRDGTRIAFLRNERDHETGGGQRRRDGTRSRLAGASTRSRQSTGPRTAIASASSATSSSPAQVTACPSSCSPLTALDPASRSTSVTSPPTGGPHGVLRQATRSCSEGSHRR